MSNKTKIISLVGSPCSGKSTGAAYLYYLLKSRGENTELVREYIKDWIWESRTHNKYDQMYFLGKQIRQETLLYSKVDWIITDAPIINNLYYAQKYCPTNIAEGVKAATLSFYKEAKYDGYEHIHIFLNRNKPYLSHGRYQSEVEADEIGREIKELFNKMEIKYFDTTADEKDLKNTLKSIMIGV